MKSNSHPPPKIVIAGRSNVGKSTLFNRVIKKRKAIVEKSEATTRDRISEIVNHAGRVFELVDTGGIDLDNKKDIFRRVEQQMLTAVRQADKIIFLCDVKTGVMPMDQKICELLRRSNKKTILVVNKVDNKGLLQDVFEFYSLGMGEPLPVSSIHGLGVEGLLDIIVRDIDPLSGEARPCSKTGQGPAFPRVKLAVVGRPNSGKSSFVNAVLGEDRVIVSPEPGTTRDSVDTYFEIGGKKFIITDTAGIRSKGKIKDVVTYFSIVRTEESIKKSDAVLIIFDGIEGVTKEDFKIIGAVQDDLRPFVLAVNKWDLCIREGLSEKKYEDAIRRGLRFIYDAPVIFMSALTGENVKKALFLIHGLAVKSQTNFSTSLLNEILKQITIKATRLYSISQLKNTVPAFEIFAKSPSAINEPDKRHIMNVLRRELGLKGIPLKISFKKKRF